MKVEAKGFQTTEHAGLTLEVGKDLRVDLTVQPGEQSQMVPSNWRTPYGGHHQHDARWNAE